MNTRSELVGLPVQMIMGVEHETHSHAPNHLTFLDKLALWVSWAAAAGIFLTLGWMAMAPDDPYGAVSLLQRSSSTSMWFQAAGLAVVASAVGTILVGRALPYAGPFAAAIGLAVVSLRGRTAESLLIAARASELGTSGLAIQLLYESCAWIFVMVLAFLMAAAVMRWCYPGTLPHENVPIVRSNGLPLAAFAPIAAVIGLLAFAIIGAGMNSREIRHTQVIFVVAAAIWLGCFFAYRIVPSRHIHWYMLTVLLMCVAGYVIAAMQRDSENLPLAVPPSNFLRVLPIQFVAVGAAACIAAYWSNLNHAMAMVEVDSDESEEPG